MGRPAGDGLANRRFESPPLRPTARGCWRGYCGLGGKALGDHLVCSPCGGGGSCIRGDPGARGAGAGGAAVALAEKTLDYTIAPRGQRHLAPQACMPACCRIDPVTRAPIQAERIAAASSRSRARAWGSVAARRASSSISCCRARLSNSSRTGRVSSQLGSMPAGIWANWPAA
jgi:hypothetical protein